MLKKWELRNGGRTVRTLEMTEEQASDFVSFEGDTLVEIPTRTLSDGTYRQGRPASNHISEEARWILTDPKTISRIAAKIELFEIDSKRKEEEARIKNYKPEYFCRVRNGIVEGPDI